MHTDTCSNLASLECAPCNCYVEGSTSASCDAVEQCTCKGTFKGLKCSNRDCQMNSWLAWSNCPCGYTIPKSRSRTVRLHPVGNGKKCPTTEDKGTCTMVPCTCADIRPGFYGDRCEKRDCRVGNWSPWNTGHCSIAWGGLLRGNVCNYQCNGEWGCTPQKTRSRNVVIHKVGAGLGCPTLSQSDSCGFSCGKKCYFRLFVSTPHCQWYYKQI